MLACSGSRLLPSDGKPNRLSREAPLVPGGGGNDVVAAGESVGTLLEAGGGGALATDIFAPVWPWSNDMLIGRPLRGGEYGGGGRGDPLGTNQPLAITITKPPSFCRTHLGVLDMPESAAFVASDPARRRPWAKQPILGDYTAGLRLTGSGSMKVPRENSPTRPKEACCWGSGHGMARPAIA